MSDIEPEHNGLQPELNGSQPEHNGSQPEHNGSQPDPVLLGEITPDRIPLGPCRIAIEPDADALRRGDITIVGLTPRKSNLADHMFGVLGGGAMLCFRISTFLRILERLQKGFLFRFQFEVGGHFRLEREASELELAHPGRPVRKRRGSASQ